MRRPHALLLLVLSLATAVGCAGGRARPAVDTAEPPLLRLPPSALPDGLALEQRLTFRTGGHRETVDALVEADAASVRVVAHVQGQVALRLHWDGETLQQTRADWLPAPVSAERVLSDLQYVYWPVAAINAALPPGWTMLEDGPSRRYLVRGQARDRVVGIHYGDDLIVVTSLDGRDFELDIESEALVR